MYLVGEKTLHTEGMFTHTVTRVTKQTEIISVKAADFCLHRRLDVGVSGDMTKLSKYHKHTHTHINMLYSVTMVRNSELVKLIRFFQFVCITYNILMYTYMSS